MINKVILIGNLGRDPEVRTLESGSKVAKFSMATNENYQDKNGEWQTITYWHDIVLWRNLAERAERQLKKGSTIYVEGKLTNRKYTDKDGIDRYITEVVANLFRLLDKRENSDSGFSGSNFPSEPANNYKSSYSDSSSKADTIQDSSAEEDDLPF